MFVGLVHLVYWRCGRGLGRVLRVVEGWSYLCCGWSRYRILLGETTFCSVFVIIVLVRPLANHGCVDLKP